MIQTATVLQPRNDVLPMSRNAFQNGGNNQTKSTNLTSRNSSRFDSRINTIGHNFPSSQAAHQIITTLNDNYSINRGGLMSRSHTPLKSARNSQIIDNYQPPPSTSSRSITSRLSLRPDTRALQTITSNNGSVGGNMMRMEESPRPTTSFVPSYMKNSTTGLRTPSNKRVNNNSSYFRRK